MTRFAVLEPYAAKIADKLADEGGTEPPAALLVDALREANPGRDADLAAARREATAAEQGTAPAASPEAPVDDVALGTFLRLWRSLERFVANLQPDAKRRGPAAVLDTLLSFAELNPSQRRSVRDLTQLRSRAVHGTTAVPTAAELLEGARRIRDLLLGLPECAADEAKRAAIEGALQPIEHSLDLTSGTATPAKAPLDINAGPAVALRSRNVVIVPFIVMNRAETPTTLASVTLRVDDVVYTPSLPVDGLEVSGMPFREVGTGIRLEASDALRCALYFGPSLSGVPVRLPEAVAKVQMVVQSVRDGAITLDLDVEG